MIIKSILKKKRDNLKEAFEILAGMPDDFFADGRHDPLPEKREIKLGVMNGHYCLSQPQKEAVDLINDYYGSKELEYISTGFKRFPQYDILEGLASGLISSLKGYCRNNMNIHDKNI